MTGLNINPEALVRPAQDSGVPGGELLLAYADAIIGSDLGALNDARDALAAGLGSAAVSGAAAIAANFSKNDRIANGLGIPVDDMVLKGTADLRERLGLNDFRSAVNTFRHKGD